MQAAADAEATATQREVAGSASTTVVKLTDKVSAQTKQIEEQAQALENLKADYTRQQNELQAATSSLNSAKEREKRMVLDTENVQASSQQLKVSAESTPSSG